MSFSISAALVAASRKITALFPEPCRVTGDEVAAIRERCRKSYRRWKHCEHPFPVSWPLRRGVWTDEVFKIRMAAAFRDPAAVIRLISGGGELLPFPAPPEDEEPQKEAAKVKANWGLKDVYI